MLVFFQMSGNSLITLVNSFIGLLFRILYIVIPFGRTVSRISKGSRLGISKSTIVSNIVSIAKFAKGIKSVNNVNIIRTIKD